MENIILVPKGMCSYGRCREEQTENNGQGWFLFVDYQSGHEYNLSTV